MLPALSLVHTGGMSGDIGRLKKKKNPHTYVRHSIHVQVGLSDISRANRHARKPAGQPTPESVDRRVLVGAVLLSEHNSSTGEIAILTLHS